MAMMEEKFAQETKAVIQRRGRLPPMPQSEAGPFRGISKREWVRFLGSILSLNLCRPPRGDLGETLSALYMLFCGDEIRFKRDSQFRHFSIPLDEWLEKLNPDAYRDWLARRDKDASTDDSETSSEITIEQDADEDEVDDMQIESADVEKSNPSSGSVGCVSAVATISFIQFCRSHLRCDPSNMFHKDLLARLYHSGTIMYPHEGFQGVDAIGPVKVGDNFHPLVVSIKTMANPPTINAVTAMIKLLKTANVQSAMCILLFRDPDSDDSKGFQEAARKSERQSVNKKTAYQLGREALNRPVSDVGANFVARVIAIPKTDEYGVSELLASFTRYGNETAELFASHPMLKGTAEGLGSVKDAMRGSKSASRSSSSFSNLDVAGLKESPNRGPDMIGRIDKEFLHKVNT
jgi:hypothetical protein